MSSPRSTPLSDLGRTSGARYAGRVESRPHHYYAGKRQEVHHHQEDNSSRWVWALIWFIIIVLIVYLILVSAKPTWVQKTDSHGNTTGEVDQGKAILWAIVIAIVICIIIWLVFYFGGDYDSHSAW